MVANYTPNKFKRREDAYTPGGLPGKRPDRATIVYANFVHEIFPDVPIVLGGIEASLRRFSHYDFWDNKVRHSVLLDARAKIIVYGMGEKQTLQIAKMLSEGKSWYEIYQIPGIVFSLGEKEFDTFIKDKDYILLPSFEEVSQDKDRYYDFQRLLLEGMKRKKILVQRDGKRFITSKSSSILYVSRS